MSTITDAVEKKKQEDESKKPKALDLGNPPKVAIPRDRGKLRRLIALLIILISISGAAGAGYYYRKEIGDYLASWSAKKPEKPAPLTTNDETGAAKEPLNDVNLENKKSDEIISDEKEEPVVDEFPLLSISGIIFDPLDPEAIINGQSVKTGETIDGAYIVEIRKDSVRVRYKGEERVLTYR